MMKSKERFYFIYLFFPKDMQDFCVKCNGHPVYFLISCVLAPSEKVLLLKEVCYLDRRNILNRVISRPFPLKRPKNSWSVRLFLADD